MTQSLFDLWQVGVDAVRGDRAVRSALPALASPPTHVIAVGKAACDMARPVLETWPGLPCLIVTKHGHAVTLPGAPDMIEAGHPIPDAASLRAGSALAQFVQNCGQNVHLLVLVSGGASAVAELLPEGMSLEDWQVETEALVASGADIHQINTRRREVSRIKGGKLVAMFGGARVTTLAVSDVEGDALNVIGSGIGAAPAVHAFAFEARIVASNAVARGAVVSAVQGETVVEEDECLYGDITRLAPQIAARIKAGAPGLYVFGGEPTVELPAAPGRGGRNQALGLEMAREIAGLGGIEVLVAGTDGTDGPTEDAGAIVDGTTWASGGAQALVRADAGTFLAAQHALVTTGPTGTNVMDLMLVRKTGGA